MPDRTGSAMPAWARRLFVWTIRAYPREIRRAFGTDMLALAERHWLRSEGEPHRRRRLLKYWMRDTARALPRAHLENWDRHGRTARRRRKGMKTMGWMEALANDVRSGFRSLIRRPRLTGMIVLTMGLGLGANAALFSILDLTLLRPFPYEGGERMGYFMLSHTNGFNRTPGQEELDAIRTVPGFERVEATRTTTAQWDAEGDAQEVSVHFVTHGILDMLGERPVLGRSFQEADANGGEPVVLVHQHHWQTRFGGDPDVLGRTAVLDDSIFTIAGVWPASADWRPGEPADFVRVLPAGREVAEGTMTLPLVRLAADADRDAVLARTAAAVANIPDNPMDVDGWTPVVAEPSALMNDDTKRGLWLSFLGVSLLLAAAVANVANLLLGRAVQRTGELSVRLALGASRWQVVRAFLVESALFTALGLIVALVMAQAVLMLVPAVAPAGLRFGESPISDPRWIGFAALVGVLTCLAITVVPALHLRSPDVRGGMEARAGSVGGRSRAGGVLAASQVAVTLVLLTGGVLVLRSMGRMLSIDTGFELDRVLSVTVDLPDRGYEDEVERRALFQRLEEEMAALPGVEVVGLAGNRPMGFSLIFSLPHLTTAEPPAVDQETYSTIETVGAGFFDALGIELVRGRFFEPTDEGADVVLVNEAFARMVGGDVVGKQIVYPGVEERPRTVVGVVESVHAFGLVENDEDRVQVYFAGFGVTGRRGRWMVRTSGDPAELAPLVRDRAEQLIAESSVTTAVGSSYLDRYTAQHRFFVGLVGVLSGLALLLAVTGVYAVVALAVSRRTREIGLRMALGADMTRVLSEVTRRGMRPVLWGAAVGLVGAVLAGRSLGALLYEVKPADPVSLVVGLAVLVGAGVVACLIPARRAGRVDPVEALRAD